MDVLEYWTPAVDWGQFHQGPLSDRMWSAFKNLVLLCHAAEYWRDAVRANRLTPQPRPMYTPESRYMRKKRLGEWRRPLRQSETHMHRAAFLAEEKIAEMSYLIGPEDKGKPDHSLWFACALSVGRLLGHERARYKSIAFRAFDADTDLAGADPSVTAKRWLVNAGYADDDPRL